MKRWRGAGSPPPDDRRGHLQPVRTGAPAVAGILVAAGLAPCLERLEEFGFEGVDLDYPADAGFDRATLDALGALRFTGEVWAVPEGRVVLADEPILEVTAPLAVAALAAAALAVAALAARRLAGPGTQARRALVHRADRYVRRARHLIGRWEGLAYRLRGSHPDPGVPGKVIAGRVRSMLGPIEARLDIPRVHVMVIDHVALLHGEVAQGAQAQAIEDAVAAVSGVVGVESFLHIGLARGDTRPSEGARVQAPSQSLARLRAAAVNAGCDEDRAAQVVRVILLSFVSVVPSTGGIPAGRAEHVAESVLGTLRELVPEEARDLSAVPAGGAARLLGQRRTGMSPARTRARRRGPGATPRRSRRSGPSSPRAARGSRPSPPWARSAPQSA